MQAESEQPTSVTDVLTCAAQHTADDSALAGVRIAAQVLLPDLTTSSSNTYTDAQREESCAAVVSEERTAIDLVLELERSIPSGAPAEVVTWLHASMCPVHELLAICASVLGPRESRPDRKQLEQQEAASQASTSKYYNRYCKRKW